MCKFISFFHHPLTGEILVSDLCSHGNTEAALNIDPSGPYREGHYLPDEEIECRVVADDGVSSDTCNKLLKSRFPNFIDFYTWCVKQDGVTSTSIDLSSLTELPEGLRLPAGAETIDLSSLTAIPEGVKFPDGVKTLYLNSLTELPEGLRLPDGVEWIYLSSLTELPEGFKFPDGVEWIYLSSLTELPEGFRLPDGVKSHVPRTRWDEQEIIRGKKAKK